LKNALPSPADGFSLAASYGNVYYGLWSWGLYHSSDHGESWTRLFITPSPRSIVLNGAHIVLGTDSGTFCSSDNGATWSGNSETGSSQFLAYSGQYLYCCGRDLFRSSDHGLTWTSLNLGTPVYSFAADGPYLFAATATGLMRSTDGGSTWTPLFNAPLSSSYAVVVKGSYVLACDATSTNVYRSSDRGASWETFNIPGPPAITWRLR